MTLSPRLRQILFIMLKENQIISVQKLADEIKVSKRTVQRELEDVDVSLSKYGLSLQSKTGIGIWLEGDSDNKESLLSKLEEEDMIDSGDIEERRKLLILEILKDLSPKKLYYYGNIFGVSEATISNDMEAIQTWFEQCNLKLIRKPGYGVALEGSEKNYRIALRKFIDENMDNKIFRNLIDEKNRTVIDVIRNREEENIYNLLDEDILKRVVICFLSIRDKRILRLTDTSYIGLLLHITIAVSRILQHEIIEPNEDLIDKLHKDDDYDLALYIANSLEEEFQIEIPDIEIAYIFLHIKGSKLQYIDGEGMENQSEREELLSFINSMIDAYDEALSYELKQDEEFIAGLLAHLQPTFVRLKNHMMISNPLLKQIKETYSDIFQRCLKVGKLIETKLKCKVPEEEIGFLSMHFGAAVVRLENQKESKRKVNIGIVCASGIGISRLMLSKLNRFLKERADITTYGKEDLNPLILGKLDFLISSITLDNMETDIVKVSPLLIEKDLEQIDAKVRKYAKTPKKNMATTEFSRQLEQVNFTITQIKHIIKEFECIKVNNDISFDELLVAVTEKIASYNNKRLMIQEDIKKREKIATQVIPEYDFALLHSRTKGVIKPSFSVCLTKDLKEFKEPYLKSVHTVIIMLIPDDEHTKENGAILGFLSSRLIEDNEFLGVIFTGEKEKIRNFISKELKKYFNQYLETV
ncbi:BglG family transcription antiterminator [Anaerocolumna sp.]|uniref:BglG family transcription antiterminator n=1 Tax=Anaerocolumna sp. TaxID=2041569 RepID=UPI0028AB80FF|nr:BglG family transcription antiterminator [Anaerocolumna sp.]